ncbi:MAG: DUF1501 domain-containing protein [Myxococcota bacterium]
MFERRDFLKLAGLCGLSVCLPRSPLRAQESILYDGPFFVLVNAGGGWDPTSLCDPKGKLSDDEENPMNRSYFATDIVEAHGIRYAPVGYNDTFFQRFGPELLVLNGIDSATNGHDSGSRHTWSGRLAEGFPSFGALVAAAKSRASPMAYLSNGGYDLTMGLVAPTRNGNTGALQRIAYPNRIDTNNADSRYFTDATYERIRAAQAARLDEQRAETKLPRKRHAMDTLFTARIGEGEVRRLTDFLPSELDNSNNPLKRQSQLAIASYKAGLSVSVNLSIGGFDTHGNHDQNHIPRLSLLLEGVEYLLDEAERQGVRERVVVAVGSDFGRTPGYNDSNGKDHWSVTSMLLLGPGIRGGRTIGATDERHKPLSLDLTTLQPSDAGERLSPEHVHVNLRRLAGIAEHELAAQFPLALESAPDLFS